MIARNKFFRLNLRQRVYKLAECVRELEIRGGRNEELDFTPCRTYLGYLESAPEEKAREACRIARENLDGLEDLPSHDQVQKLNMVFHDLLALFGNTLSEGFFREKTIRVFDKEAPSRRFETVCILDNIRSAFNVGSIFRSCDCLGVMELALCGITPRPPDIKVCRTAMGTVETVAWRYFETGFEAIEHYRAAGYAVYAAETAGSAETLWECPFGPKTAFMLGNEEFGIAGELLEACDGVVEIPVWGVKNSMNVANAAAVVLYEAARRTYFSFVLPKEKVTSGQSLKLNDV